MPFVMLVPPVSEVKSRNGREFELLGYTRGVKVSVLRLISLRLTPIPIVGIESGLVGCFGRIQVPGISICRVLGMKALSKILVLFKVCEV